MPVARMAMIALSRASCEKANSPPARVAIGATCSIRRGERRAA
jgi:hypothetical protein